MKLNEEWKLTNPEQVNPRRSPRRSRRPLEPEIEIDGRHLVTIRRAAEIAEVAISTIYKWIQNGYLPHFRKGYWIRVDLKDLKIYTA